MNWLFPVPLNSTQLQLLYGYTQIGDATGLQGQTRTQRPGDFKDNSNIETEILEIVFFCASPVHRSIYEEK